MGFPFQSCNIFYQGSCLDGLRIFNSGIIKNSFQGPLELLTSLYSFKSNFSSTSLRIFFPKATRAVIVDFMNIFFEGPTDL